MQSKFFIKCFLLILLNNILLFSQALIIDHTSTNINQLTEPGIMQAKSALHIAYGHTSHGSQIIDGMTGLIVFANNGGKGFDLPYNIFSWNNGGTNGALDLDNSYDFSGGIDAGYYPNWVNNTRSYLGIPNSAGMGSLRSDVNVIMWAWCGQVPDKYAAGTLYTEYLDPMNQLEIDYYGVKFVYMTGHLDHWGPDANIKAGNKIIRDYCIANNKILYDFADIESFEPDGVFFEFANDDCAYYSESGTYLGNWALEWQGSHTENVDWYTCDAAHSYPINANQKAYAAWLLYTKLSGYDDMPLPIEMNYFDGVPSKNSITIQWCTASEIGCFGFHVWKKPENGDNFSRITSDSDPILAHGNSSEEHKYSFVDYNVKDYDSYTYKIEELTINDESNFYGSIVVNRNISYLDLRQNYPNPFNSYTQLQFYLPTNSNIQLLIYNISGQLVRTIANEWMEAGTKYFYWDGLDNMAYPLASGVYFYSLKTDNQILNKKMMLVR